ncbi:MAG: type 1 glutamine amidotransferase domain-containing protein [Pseudomonadota bacterium]
MSNRAEGKRLAILAADGFEEIELTSPRDAIQAAGGETVLITPDGNAIEANKHRQHGETYKADLSLNDARADDYHALLLPGGLFSPDALRTNETALTFVTSFFDAGKPVFAICHGPQILISADLVKGRKITGYPAIQRDLENAGGIVSDEAVVVDAGLVTSRSPDDMDAFNEKIVEEICEGRHEGQAA